ncbi:hypothetical protein [Agrobacterium tumefaciens]|uniref:hypothetical protein n=1 Tax=Agrobacterium tumefaciens TaxID=358 RepID=UPI0021D00E0D|nr:hypothetical protein [Agrobacterium tumefaciens]
MNLASDVMTKGDFAAAIKVSPGRVSQYISSGQIHGPALEGEGRNARIVASIAMQQLQRTLDPSQRFGGNGAALKAGNDLFPAGTQPSPAPTASKPSTLPLSPPVDELAELRIRRERVATERAEREEQLEIGRYMLADDARREIAKAVAAAFAVMDQGIAEIASELSEKFSVPQRDLQYALTKSFRGVRERAAVTFQEMAGEEPEFVEDGKGEDDSE